MMESFLEVAESLATSQNITYIKPGTVCVLQDWVNPLIEITCTVKHVEVDEANPTIMYYYLIANDDSLNDKTDPRFPWAFYDMLPVGTTRLVPVVEALKEVTES